MRLPTWSPRSVLGNRISSAGDRCWRGVAARCLHALRYCETGWETVCEHQHNTGYSFDRWLRRVRHCRRAFRCTASGRRGFCADRADPLRLRHDLQGVEGNRGAPERIGRDLRDRRPRTCRHSICQSDGAACSRRSISLRQSRAARAARRDIASILARRMQSPTFLRITGGGAHGVLVTAVSPPAFSQTFACCVAWNLSLSAYRSRFPTPIFAVVLKRITVPRLDRRYAP